MSKKLVTAVIGALAVTLSAGVASAGIESVAVSPEEVEPLGTFTVTYTGCIPGETVEFVLEGDVVRTGDCGGAGRLEQPQGFRSLPNGGAGLGTASAEFPAPAVPGEYDGIAYRTNVEDEIDDLQAPAQPQGFRGGGLVAQVPSCNAVQAPGCVNFSVTVVQQQVTTTTAAPTTTTGQTPTTTSGGVSGGGATNTLPATGASDSDNTATIAIVLLVAGFGLIVATRWRSTAGET